jgi:hypothetical protein
MTEQTNILSSTATLFWRLFVPVFSTALLTVAFFAFWLIKEEHLYLSFPAIWARLAVTAILLGWMLLIYRTLWKIRRVDASDVHLYVTDYWKAARYLWTDVEKYSESHHLGRRIGHFHLRGAGMFGQKISFLPTADFEERLVALGQNDFLGQ